MNNLKAKEHVVDFLVEQSGQNSFLVTVCEIGDDGGIMVQFEGAIWGPCEVLDHIDTSAWAVGDRLLALLYSHEKCMLLIGKIRSSQKPAVRSRITIEATESLTLKCGEASVELRADGKAMVKGDDVLIRAKGTQRIRAGTVSIN